MAEQAETAAIVYEKFYDSRRRVYPSGARLFAVYADGNPLDIGQPPDVPEACIHSITRVGGSGRAARCLMLDFEPDLYPVGGVTSFTPGRAMAWAQRRHDRRERYVPYSDRADLERLRGELGALLWDEALFWIATGGPQPDGSQWTQQALADDINVNWHVEVRADQVWAAQDAWGLQWDTSSLFGTW